jgi:hypothetical protein
MIPASHILDQKHMKTTVVVLALLLALNAASPAYAQNKSKPVAQKYIGEIFTSVGGVCPYGSVPMIGQTIYRKKQPKLFSVFSNIDNWRRNAPLSGLDKQTHYFAGIDKIQLPHTFNLHHDRLGRISCIVTEGIMPGKPYRTTSPAYTYKLSEPVAPKYNGEIFTFVGGVCPFGSAPMIGQTIYRKNFPKLFSVFSNIDIWRQNAPMSRLDRRDKNYNATHYFAYIDKIQLPQTFIPFISRLGQISCIVTEGIMPGKPYRRTSW